MEHNDIEPLNIRKGDTISLTLVNGDTATFVVVKVARQYIHSTHNTYYLDNIKAVEIVKRADDGKRYYIWHEEKKDDASTTIYRTQEEAYETAKNVSAAYGVPAYACEFGYPFA